MLTPSLLILAWYATVPTAQDLQPLDHVFHISSGDALRSCDSKAQILDGYWSQMNELNSDAVKSLEEDNLFQNDNLDGLKLARAFLGFTPVYNDQVPEGSSVYTAPTTALDQARWSKAKRWFENIQTFLETEKTGIKKPKLFCESSFMVLQDESSLYRDHQGNNVLKDSGNPNSQYTLKEWEDEHHRPFELSWYFWIDVPSGDPTIREKAYIVLTKKSYPGEKDTQYSHGPLIPFPRDHNGQPSYCADDTRLATVYAHNQGLSYDDLHLQSDIMILCPESFDKVNPGDRLPGGKAPLDTLLDDMERNVLTLVYVWFAFANWLQNMFEQDWSTGVCTEKNSPWASPTVTNDNVPTATVRMASKRNFTLFEEEDW